MFRRAGIVAMRGRWRAWLAKFLRLQLGYAY
jgi:hypothetical protein